MREGVAYRIVGGVRFYERKEIKDTLAYLKLIVNPYDDVSMRRVINVPARGIGKGVMDALESLGPPADLPPLLAVGLDPVASSNALWVRIERAINERAMPNRAITSLTAFRDLIVNLTEVARRDPVSITVGKTLDQSGYLHDLREERSEEARGAHREPDGAGLGGHASTKPAIPSRRSAGSSISCRSCRRPTRNRATRTRACG